MSVSESELWYHKMREPSCCSFMYKLNWLLELLKLETRAQGQAGFSYFIYYLLHGLVYNYYYHRYFLCVFFGSKIKIMVLIYIFIFNLKRGDILISVVREWCRKLVRWIRIRVMAGNVGVNPLIQNNFFFLLIFVLGCLFPFDFL